MSAPVSPKPKIRFDMNEYEDSQNSSVSHEEFRKLNVPATLDRAASRKTRQHIMHIADTNQDKKLQIEEFAKLACAIKKHYGAEYNAATEADGIFSLSDAVQILADHRDLTLEDVQNQVIQKIDKVASQPQVSPRKR